jgi:hypothetical protein
MEPRDLPSFNAVKITRQTSLNQAQIDKRRIKTIFNHFRNRHARFNWWGGIFSFSQEKPANQHF